ncbi:MAG TPA: acyl-CoA thioesterase domain-containing protein, partial [Burkholderiales bacterium]|nr:acyl-CoA thioesterase domain-containing protein [Burkholderiales bacterium]
MFVLQDGLYLPTDRSRGPWDPGFLHGGAAAALLAHGVEAERKDPEMVISKIAFDLMRPVPMAPLSLSAQVVRDGKRVRYVDVTLRSKDQLVARAAAVML